MLCSSSLSIEDAPAWPEAGAPPPGTDGVLPGSSTNPSILKAQGAREEEGWTRQMANQENAYYELAKNYLSFLTVTRVLHPIHKAQCDIHMNCGRNMHQRTFIYIACRTLYESHGLSDSLRTYSSHISYRLSAFRNAGSECIA